MRDFAFLTALGGVYWQAYCQHLVVMLRSMDRVAPKLRTPVVIAHDGRITDRVRDALLVERPEIELVEVDRTPYEKHKKTQPPYMLFEAWNPETVKAKTVVVLGVDMVFLKPWEYFLEAKGPIRAWREPSRPCWNSGALLITEPLICRKEFEALLATDHDGRYGRDQAIVNQRYGAKIEAHPPWVQEFNTDGGYQKATMIVHFIHKYGAACSRITDFWKRFYEAFMRPEELRLALKQETYWWEALRDG